MPRYKRKPPPPPPFSRSRFRKRRCTTRATLASFTPPILHLPYELLLAIFHQLSGQEDVDALARTHPVFKVVHRENIQRIEKAVRCNDIARFVEKETGYRSLYLMKFARAISVLHRTLDLEYAFCSLFNDEYFQNLRRDYKDDYGFWLRSYRNQAVCLHMLGFFDSAPTLDLWYKQRFRPMFSGYPGMNIDFSEFFKEPSHPIADLRRGHRQSITWCPRARFEDIELLMVVRLWCCWSLRYYARPGPYNILPSWLELSVSDFMSLFTPDVAHRAREFARRFLKVHTDKQLWDRIGGQAPFGGLLDFIAMRELADISEIEIPMDEEERDMVSYWVRRPHWLIPSLEGVDKLDICALCDGDRRGRKSRVLSCSMP